MKEQNRTRLLCLHFFLLPRHGHRHFRLVAFNATAVTTSAITKTMFSLCKTISVAPVIPILFPPFLLSSRLRLISTFEIFINFP